MRRFLQLALLAGFSLALALGVSELALRLIGFSYHLRPEQIQLGWPRSLAALDSDYRADPDLLWVHTDYDQRLAAARADRPTFAFLGDSCTDYTHYPEFLLADLAQRHPGVRFPAINLGTAGWTTFQGLRQLRRDALPLHPRVITIFYGWNDHWIGFGLPDRDVASLLQKTGSRWQNVRLVQLGEKAWIALHRSADNRRVPLPEFRANLHAMVKEARDGGAVPVLITAPTSHEVGKEPGYLKGIWIKNLGELVPLHQQYVDAVRAVGKEDKAVVCDLAAEFATIPSERRVGLFLKDGIHFNRHGAQRAAGLLVECLEEVGVVGRR